MINITEITRIKALLEKAKRDELIAFVVNGETSNMEKLQAQNLQHLFDVARENGVRYLYVGKGEICGCENIRTPGTPWPAMWKIARDVGFEGCCGNTDQYQCRGSEIAFPDDSYGAWDLKRGKKLLDGVAEKKNFKRVITRKREKYTS